MFLAYKLNKSEVEVLEMGVDEFNRWGAFFKIMDRKQ